jgi:hypothetical protein
MSKDRKITPFIIIFYIIVYFLPVAELPDYFWFGAALTERVMMLKNYARRHAFLYLAPAFLILIEILVVARQVLVTRYLGGFGYRNNFGRVFRRDTASAADIDVRAAGIGPGLNFPYVTIIRQIIGNTRILTFAIPAVVNFKYSEA